MKHNHIQRLVSFLALTLTVFLLQQVKAEEIHQDNDVASLTAREVFTKIDIPALDIIPPYTRLDMLDYWDADSVYKASNVMDGLSWIEAMDKDYLRLHITNVSNLELKILPAKKDDIVMTVYTVGTSEQAKDSEINFYNSQLEKLQTEKYLEIPELKDFFEIPKGSLTSIKEIREMIPFPTVAYSISETGNILSARLTVEEFINADDWNIIKLFLKPSVTAEWKKEKFKF